jgi:hypothetical protein
MTIIGSDIGFGDVKISKRNKENKIKSNKKSSVASVAPKEATDMPMFEGQRYYLGKTALLSQTSSIIDMTEYSNLHKLSPLFLWQIIKENKLTTEEIDYIVVGLSFSQIENASKYIKRLSKFKINNELFDLSEKILLIPQGVGAKYTIEKFYDNVPSNYLIIDIGFLTIDSVDVIDNIVRPENVKGKQGLGIIKIARNIQEYIADKFEEHISLKEAKEIIETKKFFISGKEHDLTSLIENLSEKYTKSIMRYLEDIHQREFKKYRKIYFVGGGAHFIKKTNPVIEVLKSPEYANSIGNLLKGEEEFLKNK